VTRPYARPLATLATLLAIAVPAKSDASTYPGGCNTRACLKRSCKAACRERVRLKAGRRHMLRVIAPFRAWLRALRWCESTNDYRAVSPNGAFRGAYQFTYGTWQSVGGTGDPAAASALEQDFRAVLLRLRIGNPHQAAGWPLCG
jgi:hypothetical protein